MKLVTAVITTHNRLVLLKRAINSVQMQTYPKIELIVVDDASDDGTKEFCSDRFFHYIYISKEESKGGNYARNLGVKAAKGEYIAFLDDDDYWLPEKIEKQVQLIEKMDCELVHGGRKLEIVFNKGVLYREVLPNSDCWGDMNKKILFTICCTTSNILVKRRALLDVGLFDERLGFWQEYELTIRLAQRKPFYFVNEPISVYRVDRQDKKRLTNKYEPWKTAVCYIYRKHARLYSKLNFIERLQVYILYLNDASHRCKGSKLNRKYYILYTQWFILSFPFRVIHKLRKIFKSSPLQ